MCKCAITSSALIAFIFISLTTMLWFASIVVFAFLLSCSSRISFFFWPSYGAHWIPGRISCWIVGSVTKPLFSSGLSLRPPPLRRGELLSCPGHPSWARPPRPEMSATSVLYKPGVLHISPSTFYANILLQWTSKHIQCYLRC